MSKKARLSGLRAEKKKRLDLLVKYGNISHVSLIATLSRQIEKIRGLIKGLDPDKTMAAMGLTPRECEIARFLLKGWTNEAIAKKAFISSNTVKKHMRQIQGKLGAENRAAIIIYLKNHLDKEV
jgi:DNA-binding NarL/FixJ family response regulator